MQDDASLDGLYAQYGDGKIARKDLEAAIYNMIRKMIPCIQGLTREDSEDFAPWLYPRIGRAVDVYRDTGSSFAAHITTMIHMGAREYKRSHFKRRKTEDAAWTSSVCDWRVGEAEFSGDDPACVEGAEPGGKGRGGIVKNSRQALTLILKCCEHVSDDFLERAAPRVGVEAGVLREMTGALVQDRARRIAKAQRLQRHANALLCRIVALEKFLCETVGDEALRKRLEARVAFCRDKLARIRERLTKLRRHPSNAMIARLLGVKKGTVDSAMHALRLSARKGLCIPD
ncbi:MAG: hypothetical protein FWE09_04150 [Treponema sp.]|nr:hypothetical protein [Treponema sp.]